MQSFFCKTYFKLTGGMLVVIAGIGGARYASAAGWGSFRDLTNTAGKFISTTVFPVIVSLAVLFFFGNLIFFIVNNKNEKEREVFKKYSVNAVIALFILLTMWGIVGIGTRTFFGVSPFIPQLPVHD